MVELLLGIFGGVWRRIDGGDSAPKFWHLAPALVLPYLFMFHSPETALAWLIAWVALLDGFKDWTDYGYMSMRFTGYAALAVALAGVSPWFILVGLGVGLFYPIANTLKIPHYTLIAEVIAGFGMFYGIFI